MRGIDAARGLNDFVSPKNIEYLLIRRWRCSDLSGANFFNFGFVSPPSIQLFSPLILFVSSLIAGYSSADIKIDDSLSSEVN